MAWEMLHKFAKWKGKQVASLPLLRSHLSEVTAKPASLVSGKIILFIQIQKLSVMNPKDSLRWKLAFFMVEKEN